MSDEGFSQFSSAAPHTMNITPEPMSVNKERRKVEYQMRRPIDAYQRAQLRNGAIMMMVLGSAIVCVLSFAMWFAKGLGL
jgi:hypothetical protein